VKREKCFEEKDVSEYQCLFEGRAKLRRTKDEQKTNKRRTKDEQKTNNERCKTHGQI